MVKPPGFQQSKVEKASFDAVGAREEVNEVISEVDMHPARAARAAFVKLARQCLASESFTKNVKAIVNALEDAYADGYTAGSDAASEAAFYERYRED